MISLVGGLRRRQRISYKPPAGGASGPAFRSISQGQSTTGAFTMAVPTGAASGDQLLMFVQVFGDSKGYTAGSPSAGWTQIAFNDTYHPFAPCNTFAVYKRTATASESTYSWSGGANWYNGMGFVMAVSGATAVDVVGAMPASYVAPSVTTTTATDLLVYACGQGSSAFAMTKPASMTERVNTTPTIEHFRTVIATQTLTASGATGTRSIITIYEDSGFTSLLIAVK